MHINNLCFIIIIIYNLHILYKYNIYARHTADALSCTLHNISGGQQAPDIATYPGRAERRPYYTISGDGVGSATRLHAYTNHERAHRGF